MKNFFEWFKTFFNEQDGASTTRALTWIWTGTLCSMLLLFSVAIVCKAEKIEDLKLPIAESGLIMLTSAYLAAKVGQRVWGEKSSGTTTTTLTLPSGSMSTTLTSAPQTGTQISGSIA